MIKQKLRQIYQPQEKIIKKFLSPGKINAGCNSHPAKKKAYY